LVRYLHPNPVRMKQPKKLESYRWSSHHAYSGKALPVTVDTALVLVHRVEHRIGVS
jgi:hypothetical protein